MNRSKRVYVEVLGMTWTITKGYATGGLVSCIMIRQGETGSRLAMLRTSCGDLVKNQLPPVQDFMTWTDKALKNLIVCIINNMGSKYVGCPIVYMSVDIDMTDAELGRIVCNGNQLTRCFDVIQRSENGRIVISHYKDKLGIDNRQDDFDGDMQESNDKNQTVEDSQNVKEVFDKLKKAREEFNELLTICENNYSDNALVVNGLHLLNFIDDLDKLTNFGEYEELPEETRIKFDRVIVMCNKLAVGVGNLIKTNKFIFVNTLTKCIESQSCEQSLEVTHNNDIVNRVANNMYK